MCHLYRCYNQGFTFVSAAERVLFGYTQTGFSFQCEEEMKQLTVSTPHQCQAMGLQTKDIFNYVSSLLKKEI